MAQETETGHFELIGRRVLLALVGGLLPFVLAPALVLVHAPGEVTIAGSPAWIIVAVAETYLLTGVGMWGVLMPLRLRSVRSRLAELEAAGQRSGGVER